MTRSAVEVEERTGPSEEKIRHELDLLVADQVFRSSKRSVAFLRYVVEQTLEGAGDQLKERTIGIEVFGRDPAYDTSGDHVVRTAATELRKRLAIYYGDERHKNELRISLLPGSYVPHFALPPAEDGKAGGEEPALLLSLPLPEILESSAELSSASAEAAPVSGNSRKLFYVFVAALMLIAGWQGAKVFRSESPRTRFWNPVLHASSPVLIAVGDVPHGPPTMSPNDGADTPPSPKPASDPGSVPFEDTVTIARITSVLSDGGKQVLIRPESSSSFSDLREGPVVLIGAFNNEWSLRLTRPLRFSLAMDAGHHMIYIRDRDHPESRQWNWNIDPHEANPNKVSSTPGHDYALISRIANSETGQVVVVVGGLYTYGTQAAGEFLADPQLMSLARSLPLDATKKNLQIVLETDVTQQTPGPPRVVGFASN